MILRKTIKIEAPLAKFKEKVLVHNYRRRNKDNSPIWEEGEVVGVSYGGKYSPTLYWNYYIRVLRNENSLCVTDEGIKKIQYVKEKNGSKKRGTTSEPLARKSKTTKSGLRGLSK